MSDLKKEAKNIKKTVGIKTKMNSKELNNIQGF